jgi:hypothetical protein
MKGVQESLNPHNYPSWLYKYFPDSHFMIYDVNILQYFFIRYMFMIM